MQKYCSRCSQTKSIDEFYRRKAAKDGHQERCKSCQDKYYYSYKEKNLEKVRAYVKEYNARPESKEKRKPYMEEWYRKSPRQSLRASLLNVRKRKNMPDDAVTLDELCEMFERQQGKCALSGIEMTWRKGKITATSISIDRIDPDVGYSKTNVRLVCYAINAFRGRMTDDEMFVMALTLISNMKKPKLRLVS